jgi:uncharacterized membrane protein
VGAPIVLFTVDFAAVGLDLALVRFDGENAAAERLAAARGRRGGDPPWTREVGFVEHHHSRNLVLRGTFAGHFLDVDEIDHVSQKGAGEGAIAGSLIGVLLGPPGIALGLLIGGIVGSQVGEPDETDEPEPQALAEQLRELIPRASSAIVMIAAPPEVDEMLAAIGEGSQGTIRRALTEEEVAALEASLRSAPPASPPPRENPG